MAWRRSGDKPLSEPMMISLPTHICVTWPQWVNTLRPRQNGRHFPDNIFIFIFLNEDVRVLIEISLKFFPRGPINNIPALVQIMAWCRPGDKPLSAPMMVTLPTHICITRPQWVNLYWWKLSEHSMWPLLILNWFDNIIFACCQSCRIWLHLICFSSPFNCCAAGYQWQRSHLHPVWCLYCPNLRSLATWYWGQTGAGHWQWRDCGPDTILPQSLTRVTGIWDH